MREKRMPDDPPKLQPQVYSSARCQIEKPLLDKLVRDRRHASSYLPTCKLNATRRSFPCTAFGPISCLLMAI